MNAEKSDKTAAEKKRTTESEAAVGRDSSADDLNVCEKAPEWAEHQRFDDDDQPCDDGRAGKLKDK